MKKIQIFSIVLLLFAGIWACKKKTDQILSPDQLSVGSYIRLDSTISNEFNYASIATSSVSWMVHGVGESISTITVYASPTNSNSVSTWKKIKDIPVTGNKATISVTGQELATALGVAPTALSPGNQYTLFTEVTTVSGKKYSINNTNGELESAAAYNMAFRLPGTITCPFNPADLGTLPANFKVVYDNDWQDFNPGEIVQVTAATATSISLVAYPAPAFGSNRQPEVITINPANGRATITTPQTIGTYGSVVTKISTNASKNSYVFTCTGDIILYHDILYGTTTYRSQLLRLKKI